MLWNIQTLNSPLQCSMDSRYNVPSWQFARSQIGNHRYGTSGHAVRLAGSVQLRGNRPVKLAVPASGTVRPLDHGSGVVDDGGIDPDWRGQVGAGLDVEGSAGWRKHGKIVFTGTALDLEVKERRHNVRFKNRSSRTHDIKAAVEEGTTEQILAACDTGIAGGPIHSIRGS